MVPYIVWFKLKSTTTISLGDIIKSIYIAASKLKSPDQETSFARCKCTTNYCEIGLWILEFKLKLDIVQKVVLHIQNQFWSKAINDTIAQPVMIKKCVKNCGMTGDAMTYYFKPW